MSLVLALKILSLAILPFLFAMFAWVKNILAKLAFSHSILCRMPYCKPLIDELLLSHQNSCSFIDC